MPKWEGFMGEEKKQPTAEEIEREQAITRWNLYRFTKWRILNTFNDPSTLKPKYCFTAEVEEKCQRILRRAQEALPFLIPLASEEMYSDSYQPPAVKLTWGQILMCWQRISIGQAGPDGQTVFRPVSWRDWRHFPRLLRMLPMILGTIWYEVRQSESSSR